MNNDEIILRQQRLLVRSAQLRLNLADQALIFKKPLAVVDQVQVGLHWVYRNPLLPLGALLILVVVRPRRAIRCGGRAWAAWKTFKRARNWIAKLPLQ